MGCVSSIGNEKEIQDMGNYKVDLAGNRQKRRNSLTFDDEETYYSPKSRVQAVRSLGFGSTHHLHKSALGEDYEAQRLVRELSKRASQLDLPEYKYIALVAHNEMKPSMMNFVKRHIEFFRRCRVVTTGSTGSALEKKLGLKITLKVSSGPLGGDQEIGALISQRQLGAVFFFRDPLSSHPHESDIQALARLCDVHNVMASTNPASGDALVYSLQHFKHARDLLLHEKKEQHGETDVVKAYKRRQAAVINTVSKTPAVKAKKTPADTLGTFFPGVPVSARKSSKTPKKLPMPSQRAAPKVVKRSSQYKSPKIAVPRLDSNLRVYREKSSVKYPMASEQEIEYQMGASEIAMIEAGGRTMPHLYTSASEGMSKSNFELLSPKGMSPRAH